MKFRKANLSDLSAIIEMIADDELGKTREDFRTPLPKFYIDAFHIIDNDENQEIIVVENQNKEIIGTLQLTYIQYLNRKASLRAQIETVRVRSDQRGNGVGKKMMQYAIDRAKERKAYLIQLTTDKKRPKALKFYESLGFVSSHQGMKLHL